jgi:uncharacterized protein (TIGR00369 family)
MACVTALKHGKRTGMNDKPGVTAKPRNYMMKPGEQPPFADLMGMKITHVSPERVTAELLVTKDLTNRNGVLHGGALMGFADNLGGTAATANLPATGGSTATIESKTNFFASIPEGDVAMAECTPLHRGRTTTVWQTRITRSDGKLAAIVTQTQLMMTKPGA